MSQVRHLPALLIAAVLAFSPAVLGQDVDEEYPEEDVGPVFNPWRPDRWDAVVDEVPLPGPKPPQPSSSTVSVSTLKVPKKAGKAYGRRDHDPAAGRGLPQARRTERAGPAADR